MKSIALASAFTLTSFAAFAGGLDPVQTEPTITMPIEVIEEQTVSSSHGILVPLFALIMFGAAITK